MSRKTKQDILGLSALPFLIFCLCAPPLPAGEQKLKVEEVVAKHLRSIGTPEARASVKSRLATGIVEAVFRLGGQGALSGKGQILSEGRKSSISFLFSTSDYPGEQIVFDGEKVAAGQVRPGQRTSLSTFLFAYDVIAKEGLLGGALSTAWPMLDLDARQAKVEYSGLKKIEGKQLHEVKYKAKKSPADCQITLYFDPETFRHVRTQYRIVRSAGMVSDPTQSSSSQDTIYTLLETFDNYKEVDGLTLPLATRLDLTIEAQSATIMSRWSLAITGITHNSQVDPKSFTIR